MTERWVETQAQHLNVHGHLDVVARLAKPVIQGNTKVAGIKLEHTRLMRLMEVLLQKANGNLRTWNMAKLHRTILDQFSIKPADYTLLQLRYDVRKLRLHGPLNVFPTLTTTDSTPSDSSRRSSWFNYAAASTAHWHSAYFAIVLASNIHPIPNLSVRISG